MTFRGRLLLAASWLACRLPERSAFRVAGLVGDLWYRLAPDRAAQARRNLERVCRSLARLGTAAAPRSGPPRPIPRPLERLVRSAFRHHARYYLEVARGPGITREYVDERLQMDTPELIAEAVVPGKAVLFVGLHLGTVELAVIFLAFQVGETVTPMETVDDPGVQAYFERTRGVAGIRLVGLREARRELTRRAGQRHPGRPRRRSRPDRRRHPDRAVRGARDAADGSGHARDRERRPDLRDDRPARWDGPVPRQADPDRGPGRRHAARARHDDDDRLAAAFETLIADAPDQWWAIFFPIWPDLEAGAGTAVVEDRTARIVGERRHDGRLGAAAPTCTSTPCACDGTAGVEDILDHVERRTDLDVIAITDHERIDAARGGPDDRARSRPARVEVVVGEEVTTLGGHLLALVVDRRRSGRSARCASRSSRSTTRRPGDPRPSAGPATRCAPRAGVLRRLLDDPDPRHTPTASRRSTRRRSASRGTVAWCASPTITGSPISATAMPTLSTPSAPAGRPSRAATRPSCGAAIETGTTEHGGTFHQTAGQLGTFGQQLRKRGRDARDEVAGRVRRDGTGRDHGYPGGRQRPPRFETAEPGAGSGPGTDR